MTYRVVMDATAKSDLREIAQYIALRAGDRDAGKKFVAGLKEHCQSLHTFPERGALPKDHLLVSLGYRFLAYKGYLAFYVTDSDQRTVFIRAIWHEKMDYTRQTVKLVQYRLKLQESAMIYDSGE